MDEIEVLTRALTRAQERDLIAALDGRLTNVEGKPGRPVRALEALHLVDVTVRQGSFSAHPSLTGDSVARRIVGL